MRSVPAIDVTALKALKALVEKCHKKGVTVVFSHVNEHPKQTMEKAGLVEIIGEENFRPNIDAAIDWAEELIKK